MANLIDGDYFIINGRSIKNGFAATLNVYRLRNDNKIPADHLYTTSWTEYIHLCGLGWIGEGLAFCLNTEDKTTAVYRLYNSNDGYHFYTTSTTERDSLVTAGYTLEGVAWYGNASGTGHAPVYRLRNNSAGGVHFYTCSVGEYNNCLSNGWTSEGISFYSGGVYALDLAENNIGNKSNIRIFPAGDTDAQVWHVSTRDDGTRRITNRSCGKSIDVENGTLTNGQNVQLYDSDDSTGQKWDIESAGSNLTYKGVEYESYFIKVHTSGDSWVMEVFNNGNEEDTYNLSPGLNVDISKYTTGSDRAWAFVPVNPLRLTGEVFTIRPYNKPSMYLDATSGNIEGANVNLYSHSGSKLQFWAIDSVDQENTNDKYLLMNAGVALYSSNAIQRYATVDTTKDINDTSDSVYKNVYLRTKSSNYLDHMSWGITSYGTEVVDGVAAAIVRFDIGNYPNCLDDKNGAVSNTSNVGIYKNNNTNAQRWLLVPTGGTFDPTIPVPQRIYLNSAIGNIDAGDRPYQDKVYPGWQCTDAWFEGDNHYEHRIRTRLMRVGATSFGKWNTDKWVWEPSAITTSDDKTLAWLTDGLDVSYDTSVYKNREVEIQVRCIGTRGDSLLTIHGSYGVGINRIIFVPTFNISAATMTIDGLQFTYTHDYSGSAYLYGMRIQYSSDKTVWHDFLQYEHSFTALPKSGTFTVPLSELTYWPEPGVYVRIIYQVGNDQHARWTYKQWHSDPLLIGEYVGGDLEIDYSITQYIRHTGLVTISNSDYNSSVYLIQNGSTIQQLSTFDDLADAKTKFLLPYVWRGSQTIAIKCVKKNTQTWGVVVKKLDTTNLDMTPVHVWITEDNEIVCLDCRENEKLASEDTLSATYNKVSLNDREHEFVTFGKTVQSTPNAVGAIMYSDTYGKTDCTLAEVRALIGTHCLYRNPFGDLLHVAVTGVSDETHHDYATCTVSMVEETR